MAGAELNDDMLSIKEETTVVLTPKGGTLQTYAYREALLTLFIEKEFTTSSGL